MSIFRIWHGSSTYPRTGETWDTAFHSIADMINVSGASLESGDTALLASDHVCQSGTDPLWTFPTSMSFISVDRSGYPNETYLFGASEMTTASPTSMQSASGSKQILFKGIKFGANTRSSDYIQCYLYGSRVIFNDCELFLNGQGCYLKSFLVCDVTLENCILHSTNTTNERLIILQSATNFIIRNCTFPETISVNMDFIAATSTTDGMINLLVENCDLSQFPVVFHTTNDGASIDAVFRNCRFKQGGTLLSGPLNFYNSIRCENCSEATITTSPSGVSDGKSLSIDHLYHDSNIYRAASDGVKNWSWGIDSSASASTLFPADLPYPLTTWHSGDGSKTLRIHLLSDDASLKDDEVGAMVYWGSEDVPAYANGNYLNTVADYGLGVTTATSTYLKAGSIGNWTGGGGLNAYYIEIAGLNPTNPGVVEVYVRFSKPNTNLWICPNLILQ